MSDPATYSLHHSFSRSLSHYYVAKLVVARPLFEFLMTPSLPDNASPPYILSLMAAHSFLFNDTSLATHIVHTIVSSVLSIP